MEPKITYEVEYYFYQYHNGTMPNGYNKLRIETSTLDQARQLVDKIKLSHKQTLDGVQQTTDAIDKLIPGDGYFYTTPTIFKLTREQVVFGEVEKRICELLAKKAKDTNLPPLDL